MFKAHENFQKKLTRRESEIYANVIDGLSSKEIADKLYLSKHTVDTHRRNIIKKRRPITKNVNQQYV